MARQTTAEWKAQRTAEREKIAADDAASEIWRISAEPTPNAYSTGLDAGLAVPRIGMSGFHTCCAEVVTAMEGEPYLLGQERARRIVAAMNFLRDIPTEVFDGASLKGFAEIMHESIQVAPQRLSSPTRRMLDGLRGSPPAAPQERPQPPTPMLDLARADASRKFTLAERNAALAELRTLRQMIEPAALRPGFVFHGSTFNPDIAIEWGLPCDEEWREPTLYHSTVRDALVAEINAIDRLRRAKGDR